MDLKPNLDKSKFYDWRDYEPDYYEGADIENLDTQVLSADCKAKLIWKKTLEINDTIRKDSNSDSPSDALGDQDMKV